jgi:hypothetical protein
MRVLQLSLTPMAGMPLIMGRILKDIGIDGSVALGASRIAAMFDTSGLDAHMVTSDAALEQLVASADVVQLHGLQTFFRHAPLLDGKKIVVHIHGAPDRGCGYQPAVPHVVATPDLLDDFPEGRYIPNAIVTDALISSRPLGDGPLRVFKSPSLHDKNQAFFGQLMRTIGAHIGRRHLVYVAPRKLLAHADLIRLRASCHISLDHLHGYYGLESLESLAQGLIAVNGLSERNRKRFVEAIGHSPPFASAESEAAAAPLVLQLVESALVQRPAFEAHRAAGPAFIQEHYRAEQIAEIWQNLYQTLPTYQHLSHVPAERSIDRPSSRRGANG